MGARMSSTHTSAPRIALITGASRGLGAALAEDLAARGWHVVAVARTVGALEELDDRIQAQSRRGQGGQATLAPIDITQDDALRHLCRGIHDRWGHVDLWAHTAVQAPPLSPAGHVAIKDWDRVLATVLRATGVLIPMVEPLLRASPLDGQAVFFDDPACRDEGGGARAHFGAYAAAKAGQIALARAWAAENAALGPARAPQVTIHAPAPMPTATRARFFPGEPRGRLSPCADEARRALTALSL
jgi:NAD(P)-dependent dehydrogenase (short-subunit alcohol dehydrogenase family)